MTTLYELALEYRDAADKLSDLDLPDAVVADTLESLSGDLETKATNVAFFMRNLEVTSAAMKDAEGQLATRRKAVDNRIAGLKRFLLGAMQFAGISKIEGAYLRLSVRDNPPAVDIFDAAQVPAEFMRVPEPPPPSIDKVAIKEAIKAGREVPGAKLVQGQRLEIR